MINEDYQRFISNKKPKDLQFGFPPLVTPDYLFDFQSYLMDWSIRKGRSAIFADCGLGKTPITLVWADNVVRKENKPVLILTPLAVAPQYVREGEKFGIEVYHSKNGVLKSGINVSNYERLHYFDRSKICGVVCDESGILKHHDAKTRKAVTDFTRHIRYRLLDTATPAPNDFMELGNSSEVLGVMKYSKMLGTFFTNAGESSHDWVLKPHAKGKFWRWMSTWSRALRKPSDLGFDDERFELPDLIVEHHKVPSKNLGRGFFPKLATTLKEQREERRRTLTTRCERVAEIVPTNESCVIWCHLNDEGDLLEEIIPGAVQVAGKHSDDLKEERLNAFTKGQIRILISKPRISGFGLNWQHCSTTTFFPSHSYEQFYQAIRRFWRFGQQNDVHCHIVLSEAESTVFNNMMRKERQASEMYSGIVRAMSQSQSPIQSNNRESKKIEVPEWLSHSRK